MLDLRPLRFLPSVFFVLLLALVLVPLLSGRLAVPALLPLVPAEAWTLPFATLASLSRMFLAYVACLAFAVGFGALAALSARARSVIIPTLDILQSVPVLGFFPAVVVFFVNVFHGSRLGIELASIFLLFTCLAWNLVFGVYEAMITRPRELDEVSRAFHMPAFLRFLRFYLPVLTPKLIYNSMLSWSNGWYFLVACEIIAIGPARFELPGLGSFLARSASSGQFPLFAIGLGVLIAVIVALDLLVWRPLINWSERFRTEGGDVAMARREAPFAQLWSGLTKSRLVDRIAHRMREVLRDAGGVLFAILEPLGRRIPPIPPLRVPVRSRAALGWGVVAAGAAGLAWSSVELTRYVLAHPPSSAVRLVPVALALSLLRLLAAYAICLLWTAPVALLIATRPRVGRVLLPVCEILAAIPATALFPFLAATLGQSAIGREMAAVLLALTGMQWYLLFNLVAGIRAIPVELGEATRSMGLTRTQLLRTLLLPASLSSLVTGSVTAWGGGWNSLIISEYFVYRGDVYSTLGLGALLSRATYELGDVSLLLIGLAVMILTITLMNRLVWRPLYEQSADRYRLEA